MVSSKTIVQENGTSYKVYINGVNVGSGAYSSNNALTGNETMYLGSQGDWVQGGASTCANIKTDEVRLWNVSKTELQIRENMYKELAGTESNLVAYYKLNETSGTTADNAEGTSAYDGTLNYMTDDDWVTSGAFAGPRNTLDFDGIDDFIAVTNNSGLQPASAFTLETWVYIDAIPENYAGIIDNGTADGIGSSGGGYFLGIQSNTDRRFRTWAFNGPVYPDNRTVLTSTDLFELDKWYHVASVYNGSSLTIYINGKISGTTSFSGTVNYTNVGSYGLNIGAFHDSNEDYRLDGMIDEVRIWSTARTAAQISENMCKTLVGNETGLQAYYRFDQYDATGQTTLYDISSNSNNGTLTNMDATIDWDDSEAFNTWVGSEGTSWETAANWSDGVPVSTDNIGIVKYTGGNDPALSGSSTISVLNVAANSSLTMNANLNVNNDLVMAGNNITTGINTLTVGSSAANAGNVARSSGTVVGNLKRWFAASTVSDALFPIGTSSNYRPANISFTAAPTTGGTITASYNATNPAAAGLPLNDGGYTINTVAPDGYWPLTSADGLAGGTYSLDITADAFTGVSDYTTLHLVKRANSSSDWTVDGTHSAGTGSNGTPVVHRTGMTGFSEFGVGSNSTDNSLPVELSSFTATAGNNKVTLKWTTESEIDNEAFLLERGTDKENFELLAEIKGQGSTSSRTDYSFTDNSVFNGFTYFYRLADRDINGVVTYHPIVNATPNDKGIEFEQTGLIVEKYALHSNYPNPFNPETTIRFDVPTLNSELKNIKLNIYNSLGQLVNTLYEGQISGGKYELKWNGANSAGMNQPSGVYFLNFQSERFVQTQKMILMR